MTYPSSKQSLQRVRLFCEFLWAGFGKSLEIFQLPANGRKLFQVRNVE
jgi:hypothetical protein